MAERARVDADFAVKLFEHGYGKAPQSLRLDSEAVVNLYIMTGLDGAPDAPASSGE